MESKSIVIHKGGKEEKYKLYVEDYVLSYLKYETGSLECSEIYFYGERENDGKMYVVYGAGKSRQISLFDAYDLLEEIMCRLTQAGPVFMVRESEEIYQIKGYDVFYQDNEAMQSYMVDRQHNIVRPQQSQKEDRPVTAASLPMTGKAETKPPHAHGIMSAQLCFILIILVAIVINSSNSYDKMEQLNRSAEEVFFAIENQEADGAAADSYAAGEDVVVERDRNQENASDENTKKEEADETDQAEGGESEDVNAQEENLDNPEADVDPADAEEENLTKEKENSEAAQKEEGVLKRVEHSETGQEVVEEGTEALSRNVTRYYEVEKGDTLYTISQKIYGDTSQVGKICELNDISDPDRIRFGQKIILP